MCESKREHKKESKPTRGCRAADQRAGRSYVSSLGRAARPTTPSLYTPRTLYMRRPVVISGPAAGLSKRLKGQALEQEERVLFFWALDGRRRISSPPFLGPAQRASYLQIRRAPPQTSPSLCCAAPARVCCGQKSTRRNARGLPCHSHTHQPSNLPRFRTSSASRVICAHGTRSGALMSRIDRREAALLLLRQSSQHPSLRRLNEDDDVQGHRGGQSWVRPGRFSPKLRRPAAVR